MDGPESCSYSLPFAYRRFSELLVIISACEQNAFAELVTRIRHHSRLLTTCCAATKITAVRGPLALEQWPVSISR
jgi:hypothetical protein